MSKEQLVTAYLHGDVGRQRFVRGLVALGVSLTAALAYAQISPEIANADRGAGLAAACAHMPPQGMIHDEFCGG